MHGAHSDVGVDAEAEERVALSGLPPSPPSNRVPDNIPPTPLAPPRVRLPLPPPLPPSWTPSSRSREFNEVEVPAGPLSRAFQFGTLVKLKLPLYRPCVSRPSRAAECCPCLQAASMAVGSIGEWVSRASGVSAGVGRCVSVYLGPLVSQLHSFLVATARALSPLSFPSVMMTEANAERLAAALCEMRGAALKIGQMLSLADDKHLPPVVRRALGRVCPAFPGTYSSSASTVCLPSRRLHRQQVARALERVRAQADVMPQRQLYGVLREQLGDDWRSKFASFEEKPFAAASIGQVRFWDITHCSLP